MNEGANKKQRVIEIAKQMAMARLGARGTIPLFSGAKRTKSAQGNPSTSNIMYKTSKSGVNTWQ